MDRLFAYIGNDASLVRFAVHQSREALAQQLAGPTSGWGMGYEQESQFLLRKRPTAEDFDIMAVASDLRTQAFAIQIPDPDHLPRGKAITPTDMQPFRFRSWLFAQTGQLGAYAEHHDDLELPDFLTRNIRGTSSGELLFHRFLVHLKNARVPLQRPLAPAPATLSALAKTLDEARSWMGTPAQDAQPPRLGMVLINGRNLYLGSIGETFLIIPIKGITVNEGQPLFAGHRTKKVHHNHLRAVLVTAVRSPDGHDVGELVTDGQLGSVGADWSLKHHDMEKLLASA